MDLKWKPQWSVEETTGLLAVCSSTEVKKTKKKRGGASRTKPVSSISRWDAAGGYERSVEHIINKLKKLKKDYRNQNLVIILLGNGDVRMERRSDVAFRPAPVCGKANGSLSFCIWNRLWTSSRTSTEPAFGGNEVWQEQLQHPRIQEHCEKQVLQVCSFPLLHCWEELLCLLSQGMRMK